jgi:Glyoxalase/Bleomycin resistance protein/Dioxygenase superfamily
MVFGSLNPVQIAYHVPDPEQAARGFARDFGWGPFFYLEHIALAACNYRGTPATFDHSSAYGQAGELMVELITQHDDAPSVLRDRFTSDAVGIHHLAYFIPSLDDTLLEARASRIEIALDARTATGTCFAMLDLSRELGHMVELYEPAGDLLKFYRHVRRASEDWDGTEPFRRLMPKSTPARQP